jgi:hypothetical protein
MSDNEQIRESYSSPGSDDRGGDGPPRPRDDEYPPPRYPREEDESYPPVRRFTYRQLQQDRQYLRVLSIFYYIAAGLIALFGLFPGIYLAFGIAIVSGSMGPPPKGPPPELGFVFIGVSSLFIVLLEALAVCVVIAGRSLAAQKRYVFCFVVAILLCLQGIPIIVLGIFSIVVLARESVKELFKHGDVAFSTDEDYA